MQMFSLLLILILTKDEEWMFLNRFSSEKTSSILVPDFYRSIQLTVSAYFERLLLLSIQVYFCIFQCSMFMKLL